MIKEVSEVLEEARSGATYPLIGIIDNEQVVIKTFKNIAGIKILINEFICLEISKILGLPIPDGGICIIDKNTNIEQLLEYELCLDDVEGVGFYSKKLNKVLESVDIDYSIVYNKKDIIRILFFDHFINNEDRHDGNILLNYSDPSKGIQFNIIDHSHVFNIDSGWVKINTGIYNEIGILKKNREIYEQFNNLSDFTLEAFLDEARIYKELLNEDILKSIINQIPSIWADENKKNEILAYILHRLSIIEDICQFVYKKINSPGGDSNEISFFGIDV